jgi:hypothetical protein
MSSGQLIQRFFLGNNHGLQTFMINQFAVQIIVIG